MLLHELVNPSPSGTYVAVVPTDTTRAMLKQWAIDNSVPIDEKLHVTVLFSRQPIKVDLSTDEHVAIPLGFRQLGEALVLELKCDTIHARHEQLIAQGGTHDFDEFISHMTIAAKPGTLKIEDLAPITFALNFGGEYTEALRV